MGGASISLLPLVGGARFNLLPLLGGASLRLLPLVEDIFRNGGWRTEFLPGKNLLEDQLRLVETLNMLSTWRRWGYRGDGFRGEGDRGDGYLGNGAVVPQGAVRSEADGHVGGQLADLRLQTLRHVEI